MTYGLWPSRQCLSALHSASSQRHSHSQQDAPSPPPSLLLPSRRGCCPWADWLQVGETPGEWRIALGCGGGNGGVFSRRVRQTRLPPPLPQQRNPVWRAWALLRLCELWHSPLREWSEPSPSLWHHGLIQHPALSTAGSQRGPWAASKRAKATPACPVKRPGRFNEPLSTLKSW